MSMVPPPREPTGRAGAIARETLAATAPEPPLTDRGLSPMFNHMVKHQTTTLDTIFSALSDPTRRAILARLSRGDASVGELAEPFDISAPAISKHLRILERSGLIARRKDGRVHRIHLDATHLKDAAEWIEHYRLFWERRFDAFATYLEGLENTEEKSQ